MTKVVIKWESSPSVRHVAVFTKVVGGIRGSVETYIDRPGVPCCDGIPSRAEWGPLHTLLPALLNPAGRYRLAPMVAKTLEAQIEALFDSEPESEFAETLAPEEVAA